MTTTTKRKRPTSAQLVDDAVKAQEETVLYTRSKDQKQDRLRFLSIAQLAKKLGCSYQWCHKTLTRLKIQPEALFAGDRGRPFFAYGPETCGQVAAWLSSGRHRSWRRLTSSAKRSGLTLPPVEGVR